MNTKLRIWCIRNQYMKTVSLAWSSHWSLGGYEAILVLRNRDTSLRMPVWKHTRKLLRNGREGEEDMFIKYCCVFRPWKCCATPYWNCYETILGLFPNVSPKFQICLETVSKQSRIRFLPPINNVKLDKNFSLWTYIAEWQRETVISDSWPLSLWPVQW